MKNAFLFLSIFLVSCGSFKSPANIISADKLFIDIASPTHMGIDGIGNFFIVQSNRLLIKYNPQGEKEITYDEQALGMITSISVQNPLYIMLHYLESKTIVFLDRNFLVLQTINYESWTEDDITAAQLANDNNIWLYNNTKRKLQKYTLDGKLVVESFDLYGLTNHALYFTQIIEYNNTVYMKNIEGNVVILDNLGRYLKDFPFKIDSDLSFSITGINAVQNEKLTLNIFDEAKRSQKTVDILPSFFNLYKNELYGIYENGIAKI
jgi:hypothetical protein